MVALKTYVKWTFRAVLSSCLTTGTSSRPVEVPESLFFWPFLEMETGVKNLALKGYQSPRL